MNDKVHRESGDSRAARSRTLPEPHRVDEGVGPDGFLSVPRALWLQRTAGNAAVSGLMARTPVSIQRAFDLARDFPKVTDADAHRRAALLLCSDYNSLSSNDDKPGQLLPGHVDSEIAKLEAIQASLEAWALEVGKVKKRRWLPDLLPDPALATKIQAFRDVMVAHALSVKREQKAAFAALPGEWADAYPSVAFEPQFAGEEFTAAGMVANWFANATLSPVLKFYFSAPPLSQRDSVDFYVATTAFDGTRDAAVRIDAATKWDELNIPGDAKTIYDARIRTLKADPAAVPPADLFTKLKSSVLFSLNDMFKIFRGTATFKRITEGPPVARARGAAVVAAPAPALPAVPAV